MRPIEIKKNPSIKIPITFWLIIKEIITEIFNISILLYLLLYLIENFLPGFVSLFINMNILLGITICLGIFAVTIQKEDAKKNTTDENKITTNNILLIITLSLISTYLIFIKIKEIGNLALPTSILSGIVIFLISFLLLSGDEEKSPIQ